MKDFFKGFFMALLAILGLKKMYDKGYDDATKDIKIEEESSSKNKKAK